MLPATPALLRERLPVAFTLCTDSRTRLPIVLDEMAAGYAGALRDRVHREQEEGLRRQVAHVVAQDALTLLPNRADGEKRLRRAFSAASWVYSGCAWWNLDGFAAVNDALGHDLGDRLLVEVATRLHQVAAPHLVVRNSSDEFAVLVEHVVDPRAVEFMARRVQEALALPFRVAGRTVEISASIGVAVASPATAAPPMSGGRGRRRARHSNPMLAEISTVRPATRNGRASASWTRRAMDPTARGSKRACSTSTANSSPLRTSRAGRCWHGPRAAA